MVALLPAFALASTAPVVYQGLSIRSRLTLVLTSKERHVVVIMDLLTLLRIRQAISRILIQQEGSYASLL